MTVCVERHGKKRILAKIPYAGGFGPLQARQIPGARPLRARGGSQPGKLLGWSCPLNMQTCRMLRQVFQDELEIGPELTEWAAAEVAREHELDTLRAGHGAALERVERFYPKLWAAIQDRSYQIAGAAFLAHSGAALLADEAGSGKTIQTLAALAEAYARRVLVFAKRTALRTVWQNEAERWLGDGVQVFLARGNRAEREAVLDAYSLAPNDRILMVVCNVEMIRGRLLCPDGVAKAQCRKKCEHIKQVSYEFVPDWPQIFEYPWDAVVLDESHRVLVGKSTRAADVTQGRLGAVRLPVRDGGLKIALSATPYRGKLLNAWGTLNWLQPDKFASYWQYAEGFWDVRPEGFAGARVVGDLLPEREAELDRMLAPYVLRRTKAEVAPQLPPKIYAGTPLDPADENSPVGIWLEMTPPQARAYRDMARIAQAGLDGGVLMAHGALSEAMRLRQFASSAGRLDAAGDYHPAAPSNKLDWLLEHLEECEGKHVVASQHTALIEFFAAELARAGHRSFQITGKVSDAGRDEAVTQFQDPRQEDVRIMLLNTTAGGESITLDAADHLIFLDETYVPDEQEQVEDRIHRVSRVHQVVIYYLRSLGTIEEEICRTTMARETEVKERLDGSRGVDYNRRVLHKTA